MNCHGLSFRKLLSEQFSLELEALQKPAFSEAVQPLLYVEGV